MFSHSSFCIMCNSAVQAIRASFEISCHLDLKPQPYHRFVFNEISLNIYRVYTLSVCIVEIWPKYSKGTITAKQKGRVGGRKYLRSLIWPFKAAPSHKQRDLEIEFSNCSTFGLIGTTALLETVVYEKFGKD